MRQWKSTKLLKKNYSTSTFGRNWRIHAMADLHMRLKLRVEVVIMKYKLVYTRL